MAQNIRTHSVLEEMSVDFIYTESYCKIGKRNKGHSSNPKMASSFSFVTLVKGRAPWLHR